MKRLKILFAVLMLASASNVQAMDRAAERVAATDELFGMLKGSCASVVQMQKLIYHGADVRAFDKLGQTPLHWAASVCSVEIVKMLIDTVRDCCLGGVINYVNTSSKSSSSTPLHEAAHWNPDENVVALLIENGAVVNVYDRYGNTPLMLAEGRDESNENIVSILRTAGAIELND